MFFLEDLKYNKLYSKKRQFNIPYDKNDKRHGAAILLLSPNYEVSKSLMNNEFTIDRMKLFTGYYIEKDVMYLINNEGYLCKEYPEYDDNGVILENSNVFTETTDINIKDTIRENGDFTRAYLNMGDKILFFNELYDDSYLTEAADSIQGLDTKYKKLLFYDRLRNNKEVIALYDKVKIDNPWITRTFPILSRYKLFNIYVDLYYYNQTYLHNNTFTLIKSIDMYLEFINRYINDRRLTDAGYVKKTIYIPVYGWDNGSVPVYDFRYVLNPISVIYKKLRLNPSDLKVLGQYDIVFCGKNGYFKFNVNNLPINFHVKFKKFIEKLSTNETIEDEVDVDEPKDSVDGMTADIVENIENATGARIDDLNPIDTSDEKLKEEIEKKYKQLIQDTKDITTASNLEKAKKIEIANIDAKAKTSAATSEYAQKSAIVQKIKTIAQLARDKTEIIDKMDQDTELKQLIMDLKNEAPDGYITLDAVQVNKLNKVNDAFIKSQVGNKSIKEILDQSNKVQELPESSIPIETINDEWHHVKAINFEKEYDLEADIYKIIYDFTDNNKHMYPIAIRSIVKEDVSTSEDSMYLYTVSAYNYKNEAFTFKFYIPKLRNNRFMRLRGNEKIFSIELPLLPISKTDENTAQIVTFYKKIIMSKKNTSVGKSSTYSDKLIKALSKYKGHNIKITTGDNSRICEKYELPIDYVDLGSQFSRITFTTKSTKQKITLYFNQDEIKEVIKVDKSKGIPIGIIDDKEVLYYTVDAAVPISLFIANLIDDPELEDLYLQQKELRRATYSSCHIANADIPTIVLLAHDIGLTRAMDLAKIKYKIVKEDKVNTNNSKWITIKLNDGCLLYEITYQSVMLLDGLKECDMHSVKIMDINKKSTWIKQLECFDASQKTDMLDNFRELMMDPITVQVCKDCKLPTTYHECLIYASNLLIDNKFTKHTNLSNNRYRTNEVIAVNFYLALSSAYQAYIKLAKNNKKAVISMKPTAVIDLLLQQNTTSDLSVFQPLLEIEMKNQIATKGAGGLNEEHSYTLEKRAYDKSMENIIAQITNHAQNVGINRQTTIDPGIVGGRGYLKHSTVKDVKSVTRSMALTEALSPFMTTSDDPFRNNMGFTQTAKHGMPIKDSVPLLVTTGADAAMPYLCSDMFAFKAKADGAITEITPEYMLITYKDGSTDYVILEEQTMKNSDGGFYLTLQLVTDLKKGDKIKENQLVAWDKRSFSKKVGVHQLSYNLGCLAKIAIMTNEDGYKDSGVCSEWLSNAMASDVVTMKDVNLPPNTNILQIAKIGQPIEEGEPVLIYQNAYEDEDANMLLKNLSLEDDDVINTIGRTTVNSSITGIVSDIKIYRTCELSELSESLLKLFKEREAKIDKLKKIAKGSRTEVYFDSTEKLEQTGKLKNTDGVRIEIYTKYHDKLSVGDKLVNQTANKVVLQEVFTDAMAPYTDFRPDDKIDIIGSASSIDGRMITSIFKVGALNKLLIELQRQCASTYGKKELTMHEIYDYFNSKNL